MSLLDSLNEKQKEAAMCCDQHVRIIAGAGSGKTRVVTTRIAYLIEEKHVFPNKILAITFTNKAAKEMKERLYTLLEDKSAGIQVSTIHSFCVRLLREDIYQMGYPRNFTIVDSDDQKSILKAAYKEMHIDVKAYSYASVLSYISNCKTNFVSSERAMTLAQGFESDEIKAEVYSYYEARLKEMYALDFDDLLLYAYHILKHYADVRTKWQSRFRYLHVDEFQDVDEIQYGIIKMLTGEDSYLCVVGDPDQTIYTWRGAQVDIIMNFTRDFKNSKTIILNENYRSTPYILKTANALIKNNRNRIDKELFTRNESETKVIHYSAIDDQNEPVWVASKIKAIHNAGIQYKDIAVLYRSNYLSRALEKAFLDARIPYRIYGGIRFYDRAEIKDALSYLRLLAPKDEMDELELWKDLAVKRVINSPKRGIGPKTIDTIEEIAKNNHTNMYEVILRCDVGKGKTRANINAFVEVIERHRALVDKISIDRLMESVLMESGYIHMLQEDKEIERLENIKELMNDMDTYVQNNPDATLQEYLQTISLYTDKEEGEVPSAVQLMTIHAAKGLEFDNVFVYSLCEGIFPSERSLIEGGSAALEEERRLAYVAFTRAKQQLFLSDSSGYSYVLDKVKTPSRFVKELPEECLDELGMKPKSIFNEYKSMDAATFLSQNQRSVSMSQPVVRKKKDKIRKGDLVVHNSFGDGVVIKIEDGLATIAFEQKFGIRKISIDAPFLSKK